MRTYPCSFEKTWAAAISSLSGKSFVLDSVSKDSGIITFSFVSPDPGEYLDCGRLDYSGNNGKTGREPESIAGTAPCSELIITDEMLRPVRARRTTRLEGKVNIVFSEAGKHTTKVQVVSRYDMTVKTQSLSVKTPYQSSASVIFTTGQEGVHDAGGALRCVSLYSLERDVLDAIEQQLAGVAAGRN